MTRTLHVVLPTLRPAGGVVKTFDLVTHALALGMHARVYAVDRMRPDLPLFRTERFVGLPEDDRVTFLDRPDFVFRGDDLGLLSLPSQYGLLTRALRPGQSPERIVHYIQNVRHANPAWLEGHGVRVLQRPFARISTNDVVAASIAQLQHPTSLNTVIPLGHPHGFFAPPAPRGGLHTPLRVAYTTWKSHAGDEVARRMADDPVEFRSIRTKVGWGELRELYAWADVFLGFPDPEEGFYMPAFEAMEAQAVVVVPDVGGNMAFCRFEHNCIGVGYEDVDGYVAAIRRVAAMDRGTVDTLRRNAADSLARFDLDAERRAFGEFVEVLDRRIRAVESGELSPRRLTRTAVPAPA